MHRRLLFTLLATCLLAVGLADSANARPSAKKAIWGGAYVDGVSQFPRYRYLGAAIYQTGLSWVGIAPVRPRNPRNPNDPAYQWPDDVTRAVVEAPRYRMRVALLLMGTPSWANGGRDWQWAPRRARDFADFAYAASRRYPTVDLWMIWSEPSRAPRFQPLTPAPPGRRLTSAQATAPRAYARLLDAAYGSLKSASSRNRVIGGMSYTTGDISTWQWIRYMRLPNGRPPRLDYYGHNPFSWRGPDLRKPPSCCGQADFSDLGRLGHAVDRNLSQPGKRRRIPLYLSEYNIPTDVDSEFNYHVDRQTQASWIRSALRVVRRSRRIRALAWINLYDEAPRPDGGLVRQSGLLDYRGVPKPGYFAFRAG
jgi:hypothetical protein